VLQIFGSDIVGEWVRRSRVNLEAAGLGDCVRLDRADVLERTPPAAEGVMVANPPYGVRIGEAEELAAFYPRLGDALKQRWGGWRCYFFTADTALPKLMGLKASRRTPLVQWRARVPSVRIPHGGGSNRDRPPRPTE
jgi:Predicted N6-adenine-specific DNA methylase